MVWAFHLDYRKQNFPSVSSYFFSGRSLAAWCPYTQVLLLISGHLRDDTDAIVLSFYSSVTGALPLQTVNIDFKFSNCLLSPSKMSNFSVISKGHFQLFCILSQIVYCYLVAVPHFSHLLVVVLCFWYLLFCRVSLLISLVVCSSSNCCAFSAQPTCPTFVASSDIVIATFVIFFFFFFCAQAGFFCSIRCTVHQVGVIPPLILWNLWYLILLLLYYIDILQFSPWNCCTYCLFFAFYQLCQLGQWYRHLP